MPPANWPQGIRPVMKTDGSQLNYDADDYSDFLDLTSPLTVISEPAATFKLSVDSLDDIVEGTESVIELCNLKDVFCHTVVSIYCFLPVSSASPLSFISMNLI